MASCSLGAYIGEWPFTCDVANGNGINGTARRNGSTNTVYTETGYENGYG